MKILVIDDEKLVRWFLERALKKWNHDVISVSNGMDALELLNSESFDIVFTDLKMPAGNGSLVIEHMSEMTNPPNTIVCSAYITEEMEQAFLDKGILCLKKPFKLEELEFNIKKLLALKK